MKKTVLIVEDDLDIQDYYTFLLSSLDIRVLKAKNGKEAFSIIDSEGTIDLILLDIIMPVMDGEEFFKRLRLDRKSDISVIFCSVDEEALSSLKDIGKAQGVFFKLTKGSKLKTMVEEALHL